MLDAMVRKFYDGDGDMLAVIDHPAEVAYAIGYRVVIVKATTYREGRAKLVREFGFTPEHPYFGIEGGRERAAAGEVDFVVEGLTHCCTAHIGPAVLVIK